MSKVTNLILIFSPGENRKEKEKQLDKYSQHYEGFNIVSVENYRLPRNWYGGNKNLESNVFIGAYNNFDLDRFVSFLREISWENPEDVQIVVKEEEDFVFKMIDVFPALRDL